MADAKAQEVVKDTEEIKPNVPKEEPTHEASKSEGSNDAGLSVAKALVDALQESVNKKATEEAAKKDLSGPCLNCSNHGKRSELSAEGTCLVCGFDKSKLYGAF